MRKLKLLFAVCALLFSVSEMQAKTDVTATYLKNANLANIGGDWTCVKYTDWQIATNDTHVNVVEFWAGSGYADNKFSISQTVKLPAGYYRLAVNAFYREGWSGDGTNNDNAWIFAGKKTQNVIALNNGDLNSYTGGGIGGSGDLQKASNAFYLGKFSNEFDFEFAEETTIDIGFAGQNFTGGSWCIFGPVKIYEYTAEDYLDDYQAKYDAADAIKDSPMNSDVHSELLAAMVDKASLSTVDEAKSAIQTLKEKTEAANASIEQYAATKTALDTYGTKAAALNAAGQAAYDVSAIQADYDNGTMTADRSNDVLVAYITAYKVQGTDKTSLITNPSFESGDMTGWACSTGSDTGSKPNSNATYTMSNIAGDYLFNTWNNNVGQPVSQTVTVPAGMYYLTAIMGTDGGKTLELYGNEVKGTAASVDKGTGVFVTVENIVVVDGKLTIKAGTADNFWYKADDFNLIFIRDLLDSEKPDEVAYSDNISNSIVDADMANVTITRDIKVGFNTVVLPFDATAEQVEAAFGASTKVYTFSNSDASTVSFNEGDGSITANVPVLINATVASSSQEFNFVKIVSAASAKVDGSDFDFVGSYAPVAPITAGDYFIGNGAIYKSSGGTNMNAFRAYIKAKDPGAHIANFFINGVETTAIETLEITGKTNGKIYNLNGQEVKSAQKGIYIQNGKKFVIK